MKKKNIKLMSLLLVPMLLVFACGGSSDEEQNNNNNEQGYDQQLLLTYKQALPSATLLQAEAPSVTKVLKQSTPKAMYPMFAAPVAQEINGVIKGLLDTVEAVVALEPTAYNSESKEFVWGPFDNDDTAVGGDKAMLYIKDQGQGSSEDFRFVYAFLRGMGDDMATYEVVIWGGANPDLDNEDHGNGVILWDFEANAEFVMANYPNYGDLDRGRFAAAYAKGLDEENPAHEITWVVAAFRNFHPTDQEYATDIDYLYGHVDAGSDQLDFMDFAFETDLEWTDTGIQEEMGVTLAFYNSGVGRAEAMVSGGDLAQQLSGYDIFGEECWNESLYRNYLQFEAVAQDDSNSDYVIESFGSADNCVMTSLETIPTLDQLDQAMLFALDQVAENGIQAE